MSTVQSGSGLDLSALNKSVEIVAAEVTAGSRYVRLSRPVGRDVEYSKVVLVRAGAPLPEGWHGGHDVTPSVMVQAGLPSALIAEVNKRWKPYPFAHKLDAKNPFTATLGTLWVGAASLASLCAGAVLYLWMREAWQRDLNEALMLGSTLGLGAGVVAAVTLYATGITKRAAPLEGYPWAVLGAFGFAVPVVIGAVWGRVNLAADERALFEGLAGLDIDAADRAAGFSTVDPLVPELGADEDWGYHLGETLPDAPTYGPNDKGVLVEWSPSERYVSGLDVLLPRELRAERKEEVRWIAYLVRGTMADAVQYDNGTKTSLEFLNLRVVDVQTQTLVGHGSALADAPRRTEHPPREVTLDDDDVLSLVGKAVADAYP